MLGAISISIPELPGPVYVIAIAVLAVLLSCFGPIARFIWREVLVPAYYASHAGHQCITLMCSGIAIMSAFLWWFVPFVFASDEVKPNGKYVVSALMFLLVVILSLVVMRVVADYGKARLRQKRRDKE